MPGRLVVCLGEILDQYFGTAAALPKYWFRWVSRGYLLPKTLLGSCNTTVPVEQQVQEQLRRRDQPGRPARPVAGSYGGGSC
jgi:hypothetical protein